MNECLCGCGQLVNKKFAPGHWLRAQKVNPGQTPENVAKFKKMLTTNNPNSTKSGKARLREQALKQWRNDESRKKLLNGIRSESNVKLKSDILKRKWSDIDYANKMTEMSKKNWSNPDFVKKVRKARNLKPNKSELKLSKILAEIDDSFHYTGDFTHWIGNGKVMNPDFTSWDLKLVVELFGEPWHSLDDVNVRTNHFKKHGWDCLIVWHNELKCQETLIKRLEEKIHEKI